MPLYPVRPVASPSPAAPCRPPRRPAVLSDGLVHSVMMSVRGRQATLRVDGATVATRTLDGFVDDCGVASPSCVLYLGQRADSGTNTFPMTGLISEARLFYTVAL